MADREQHRIQRALDEVATQPAERWESLLDAQFPEEPDLARQALLWLHASRLSEVVPAAPHERYELRARLDAGGTAAVWHAYDRALGRDVALKMFSNAAEHAGVVAEARAAAKVISDHVVRVLDVHAEPTPFIVMELVAEYDPSQQELVLGFATAACPPRDLDETVRWVAQVARGVHDAHLRDVFHRDLKPQNVLVMPISRNARIADFGLAVSGATSGDAGIAICGTPEYMAPEQARGLRALDPRDPGDRRTLVAIDVWGIGAIAYALLAGRPPWHSPTRELEPWELAATAGAIAPLERTPSGQRIPHRLIRILERALAREPRDRHASAIELASELDSVIERRRTRPRPARRTAVAAMLGVFALAGAVAAAGELRGDRSPMVHAEIPDLTLDLRPQELAPVRAQALPPPAPRTRTRASRAVRAITSSSRVPLLRGESRRGPSAASSATRPVVERSIEPAAPDRAAIEREEALRRERDEAIAERDRARQELARALDELATRPSTAEPPTEDQEHTAQHTPAPAEVELLEPEARSVEVLPVTEASSAGAIGGGAHPLP